MLASGGRRDAINFSAAAETLGLHDVPKELEVFETHEGLV
jgi:hypothetical protein